MREMVWQVRFSQKRIRVNRKELRRRACSRAVIFNEARKWFDLCKCSMLGICSTGLDAGWFSKGCSGQNWVLKLTRSRKSGLNSSAVGRIGKISRISKVDNVLTRTKVIRSIRTALCSVQKQRLRFQARLCAHVYSRNSPGCVQEECIDNLQYNHKYTRSVIEQREKTCAHGSLLLVSLWMHQMFVLADSTSLERWAAGVVLNVVQ